MAAGATYEPIATTTLGSAQSSVTFSSISGAYTDLVIITNTAVASGTGAIYLRVGNGSVDTGTNYSFTYMYGNGSTIQSGNASNRNEAVIDRHATSLTGNGIASIMSYSNTTTFKSIIARGNESSNMSIVYANLWRSTSAINIITMLDENGANFAAGSTFTLYGIAAA
jgi:hypothetical protein